ncbi:MAG: (Fe-S)-binding protein [Deltaproteobacteria bacterium]|nr:(Fe-S)-binding protein [Deltaproteobacteria bacterium]
MALERVEYDASHCQRCSTCKWSHLWEVKSQRFARNCPSVVYGKFDTYAAQGKNDIVTGLLNGELSWEESKETLLDIIYRCPVCAACDISCKRVMDLDIIGVLEALREEACERGYGPLPAHKEFIQSIMNYDNVWKQPRSRRAGWAKKLGIKDLSRNGDRAEVLYYVGCTYAYKPGMDTVPRNTAAILKQAGVDFGILGAKEICCGGIADNVGDRKSFEEIARKNLELFEQIGAKTIVTNCPGCFMTFSEKYARMQNIDTGDLPYRVMHSTQYIEELVREGRISFKKDLDMQVTWHDPCHLGRRGEPYTHWEGKRVQFGLTEPPREMNRGVNGVYEAPRNILKAIPGVELIEMERIKEYAWCCGSGGGAKSAYPDFALATAKERIEEAEATGVGTIVTSCPWCEANLTDGIDGIGSNMRVEDILDLVVQAME